MSAMDLCTDCGHAKTFHSLQPRPVFCTACSGKPAIHAYKGPEQRELVTA